MEISRRGALAVFALAATHGLSASAGGKEITVFAAASLKDALDTIAADWQSATGVRVAISYGASSALAKQIEEGAPADLFISAAVNWMDVLNEGGLILAGTRRDLLGNTLVLVAHGAGLAPVAIGPGFDLADLLGDGRLAMALVDSVPAGQYGKEALTTLGVWDSVEASVAQSENVRAALALVALGEAPYGIVYGSDAVAEDRVTVVGTFPESSHRPIIYPAAVVAVSGKAEAVAFLEALSGDAADAVFKAQGFAVLN